MGNKGKIKFRQHNKVLVQSCVQYYHECWKRRCVVLHNPEVQKKVLKEESLKIMVEACKEEVEGLRRYVAVHKINLNAASVDEILSWVRSVRVFKKRACKSEHQDIRKMLNARAN